VVNSIKQFLYGLIPVGLVLLQVSCRHDPPVIKKKLATENVVIVLIDGPRYSETWGDPSHKYIPGMNLTSKEGVVFTEFYNDGVTNTVNGHGAITTGYNENLDNGGAYPSLPVSVVP
jgi:hypothetical protein